VNNKPVRKNTTNFLVISLIAFLLFQMLVINRYQSKTEKLEGKLNELVIEKRTLESSLNDISSSTIRLQSNIDKVKKENDTLSLKVNVFRDKLKQKPLPKTCNDLVSETRETNDKAIELWKR
jgi:archaellum component FlaC